MIAVYLNIACVVFLAVFSLGLAASVDPLGRVFRIALSYGVLWPLMLVLVAREVLRGLARRLL